MENTDSLINTLLTAFGKLSIAVYIVFVITMAVGSHYRSSLLRWRPFRKFVEYFGDVSLTDDGAETR